MTSELVVGVDLGRQVVGKIKEATVGLRLPQEYYLPISFVDTLKLLL